MSYFEFEKTTKAQQDSLGSAGAPIKHEWIRHMEINDAYPIPEGIKQNTLRCFCANYGSQTGKKFKVSFKMRKVIRIAQ